MLEARRVSLLSGRYELVADGRPFALWDGRVRGSGGVFDLEGRRYQVGGLKGGAVADLPGRPLPLQVFVVVVVVTTWNAAAASS